jgi:hypothetical protein
VAKVRVVALALVVALVVGLGLVLVVVRELAQALEEAEVEA